jgi:hypothetical protein
MKNALSDHFKISNLGACYFYLGIEVIRNCPCKTLRLSQEAYFRKIFLDYSIENYYNIKTFIKTSS